MSSTHHQRHGTTLTELVVAATLMVSTLSIIAPLTVRTGRMWQEVRRHQLAVDTLCNELERLTSLRAEQREPAMADLVPPDFLRGSLPAVTLTAETIRDADGTRLLLSMNWDRPGNPKPITLVGWLDAMPDHDTSQNSRDPGAASDQADSSEESR